MVNCLYEIEHPHFDFVFCFFGLSIPFELGAVVVAGAGVLLSATCLVGDSDCFCSLTTTTLIALSLDRSFVCSDLVGLFGATLAAIVSSSIVVSTRISDEDVFVFIISATSCSALTLS